MRDRVLFYAILTSVLAHLGVVAVVGHTYASRLNTPTVLPHPKFINVDLIDQSKSEQSKPLQAPKVSAPKPVVVPPPPRNTKPTNRPAPAAYKPQPVRPNHVPVAGTRPTPGAHKTAVNPGGKLNMGSASAHGDINVGPSGNTPTGWVPNENSKSPGQGSGTDSGVGKPEPPKHVDPPPPPPEPRKITIDVCSESGMLPGKYCDKTHKKTFVEGNQPTRTCTECKAPFVPTLADRAEPVLIRDARVDVPSSVEEGLSVSVTITYTVTANGDVTGVEITKSSGNRTIDREVVSKAPRMKYKPAVQNGTPRSVRKSRTYRINT